MVNIVSPADKVTFTLGQAVSASYSCTPQEGTSLKSCACPVANGAPVDTSTTGPHTFTVATEDNAGGANSVTVKYTVASPTPPPGPFAPDTLIGSQPPKKVKTTKKKVKVKFSVEAVKAGLTDPTPATFKFKVVRTS